MRSQQVVNLGQAFAQAMAAYEKGRTGEARKLAKSLLEARPDFGGAHYLSGLLALDQGHAARAVDHLARAIAITPGQPVLHVAMGRALELKGDVNAAILHYRTTLGIDSDHAEAHARLAELLGRLGKLDEALDHGRKAVAAHPGHAEAWNTLGALLQRAGQPGPAAEALRKALELRPDWPAALNNYGVALTSLRRWDQAITILEGAVGLKPSRAGYRANLAAALRLAGRPDEARAQAERATRTEPRDGDAWLELGLARQALGHAEAAAAALERATATSPDNVHAQFCLAECRRALGQADKAALAYRRCLELDPADCHGAALGLALAGAEVPPGRAPEAYVRQLFDDYADSFDSKLVGRLDYRGPALLADALARVLGTPDGTRAVLDAGCGTGLAAAMLRPWAARLDGLDLSPAMVAKAERRGLYDRVEVGEMVRGLEERPAGYDLIAAADVMGYLGDLDPVMAAARRALRPGGVLAFTAERTDTAATYVLGAKSRYAHAAAYVRQRAEAAGFTVVMLENAWARREAGAEVPGLVAVLRAP